ncbi:HelD family protein [Kineococcus sp. SYSU DK006]|uniref:HelD family protein n=1 Tax=Kineococcus sp. SYSU DK006 TaxID=3383127 RepID=UPI003D7E69E7
MGAVDEEQRFLDTFHAARDAALTLTHRRLEQVLHGGARAGQARLEREDLAAGLRRRAARLRAAEEGLCFGRLDLLDASVLHIGRTALFDTEQSPLLVDWRAPAARPFYTATARSPQGVRRRRHITTRGREVLDVQDEHLAEVAGDDSSGAGGGSDPGAGDADADAAAPSAALVSALELPRSGFARDIVSTIQAEQDDIVRQPLPGVLAVQGGPGTGKTAVALHRAAYLLYTHREQLEERGVLLVGPSSTFLDHVSRVLPALGETAVVMATPGRLFPGVDAEREDTPRTAQLKGRLEMADVVAAAVADRQEVPERPVQLDVAGFPLTVAPQVLAGCRERARSSGRPHNRARAAFAGDLVEALTAQYADQLGADPCGGPNLLDEADVAELRLEVQQADDVQELIERCWPALRPQQLLRQLLADPERLRRAAPRLGAQERALLLRGPEEPFTASDVPLLDEAAELLGDPQAGADTTGHRARTARHRWSEYAHGVLEVLHGSRSTDLEDDEEAEQVSAGDLLDADAFAELLVERYESADARTSAERAAADRDWAYGHVVVDEAQEVTPMLWRLLARRCPTRSMTLVGDLHQAGALGAPTDWAQVREWIGAADDARHWRLRQLTTGYRTPAEVMDVAAEVLRQADPAARPPRAARRSGHPTTVLTATRRQAHRCAAETALRAAADAPGTVAVIGPAEELEHVRRALQEAPAPEADDDSPVAGAGDARTRTSVLTARAAKGLEYDHVVVLDPAAVAAGGPRGQRDLYVALTRATRQLTLLRVEDDVDGDAAAGARPPAATAPGDRGRSAGGSRAARRR